VALPRCWVPLIVMIDTLPAGSTLFVVLCCPPLASSLWGGGEEAAQVELLHDERLEDRLQRTVGRTGQASGHGSVVSA